MLAQTISAPAISFFISPHPADLRGIAAAPIAEDQSRKCELGHTYVGLSKKQRLTELCYKTDARCGCGANRANTIMQTETERCHWHAIKSLVRFGWWRRRQWTA